MTDHVSRLMSLTFMLTVFPDHSGNSPRPYTCWVNTSVKRK